MSLQTAATPAADQLDDPAPAAVAGGAVQREVALGCLIPSPLNPRRDFDPAALDELAQSIAANGLLQPLLVRECAWPKGHTPFALEGKPQVAYEVICGERRLRAMGINVKAGRGQWHDPVPVRVRACSDSELVVLSATENLARRDMHPLDEAAVFDTLRKALKAEGVKGKPEDEVARRLGVGTRTVFRRLELLGCAPEVQVAYRKGDLNDQQARAFRLGAHDDQRKHLSEMKRQTWSRQPDQIKEAMLDSRIPAKAALFNLDLYTGARVVDDEDKNTEYLADTAEFRKLQRAAIDAKVAQLKKTHAFVIERKTQGYSLDSSGYQYTGATGKNSGVIVGVSEDLTRVDFRTGFVTLKVAREREAAARTKSRKGDDKDRRLVTKGQAVVAKHAKTQAMRAGVAANPTIALAAAVCALVCESSSEIRLDITNMGGCGDDHVDLTEADEARRAKALAPIKAAFDEAHKLQRKGGYHSDTFNPVGQAHVFKALAKLKVDQLLAIFAELVGEAIGTWPGYQGRAEDEAIQVAIAEAVGAPARLAAYWAPEASYFAGYGSAALNRLVSAVAPEGGTAGQLIEAKKAEKVEYLVKNSKSQNPALFPELLFADAETMAKAMAPTKKAAAAPKPAAKKAAPKEAAKAKAKRK